MSKTKDTMVSYEFIRRLYKDVDKFSRKSKLLGQLYATQSVREIGRLHTHYPGQRSELDYTKYGVWLFPNERWPEPIFYYTGIGIDHHSTVIKGYAIFLSDRCKEHQVVNLDVLFGVLPAKRQRCIERA